MRTAILTLPFHGNYGGIIQNYALQTALLRTGHEVETVNLKKSLLGKKFDIPFLTRAVRPDRSKDKQHVRRFIEENIRLTSPFYSKRDFLKYDFSKYDAVIVGSDQVWRARYAYPDLYTCYLDFLKDRRVKKIAFSASFGSDTAEYTEQQIQTCGKLIGEFDLVTVREDSALTLINDIYRWECRTPPVLISDPTILLHKEDYMSLSSGYSRRENDGGLFYYILDMTDEKRNLINKVSEELGVKPFTVIRKSRRWYDRLEDRMIPPLEEWLQAFSQASYVLTDSFHGSVFSIIFNKEFTAVGNRKRGESRFLSLLARFNLPDRLVYDEKGLHSNLHNRIDWNSVNSILDDERKRMTACLSYLDGLS